MRRGDIVVVVLQGDAGKPRPAVVVQADWFDALATVVVLPLTSHLQEAALLRINIAPSADNGLRLPSQVAIDRPQTVRQTKIGPIIGRMVDDVMQGINRALAVFLGLG
jgi:mRNA interferase MazF